MKDLNLEDYIKICNSPVNWFYDENDINFLKESLEKRVNYQLNDDEVIFTPSDGIYWDLGLNWGENNYIRDFIIRLIDLKEISLKIDGFKIAQESIPRLQDDYNLLASLEKETEKYFKNGYSSTLVYTAFRANINHSIKSDIVFQKALLKAIDSSYYTFCNWTCWGNIHGSNDPKSVHDLKPSVRYLADNVRDVVVEKIFEFLHKSYSCEYALNIFSKAGVSHLLKDQFMFVKLKKEEAK